MSLKDVFEEFAEVYNIDTTFWYSPYLNKKTSPWQKGIKTVHIFHTHIYESYVMSILTKQEVCKVLGISIRGLEIMISRGEFPKGVKIGKCLYWSEEAIQVWKCRLFSRQENWSPDTHD